MSPECRWRGAFDDAEVDALHAEGFDSPDGAGSPRSAQVGAHSLGWVTARAESRLVGFVNVIGDGGVHAWLQDVVVAAEARRHGVGTSLVAAARDGARDAGCEWLHVDFEEDLEPFYLGACGFSSTAAGLMRLAPR